MTAAAVIVILLAVWIGKSSWKKANSGAHLAALLGVVIGAWFILGAGSPAGATTLASDAADGIMAFAAGFGHFIQAIPGAR